MCVAKSEIFAFSVNNWSIGREIVGKFSHIQLVLHIHEFCSSGSTFMDSTNHGLKIFTGGNFFFRKLQKNKNMNLPCPGNYLHSIYIVMCIITKSKRWCKVYGRMRSSLAVQCLGLGTFTFMAQVQSPNQGTEIQQAVWHVSKYIHIGTVYRRMRIGYMQILFAIL